MNLYLDTCVLPRSMMETGRVYREQFSSGVGFELLMMFDLANFEDNLKQNLDQFADGPLMFHEPVWGVEHSAPRGSSAWEEGMYHIRLTQKYAKILRPSSMIFHLSNGPVLPEEKDSMLRNALESLEEMQELFPDTRLLVENVGIRANNSLLLDQDEFTDLCRDRGWPVLIDAGHANANGWDIPRLIRDLQKQVCGYHLHNNDGVNDLHNRLRDGTLDIAALVKDIVRLTPDAARVIEYSRPIYHGEPLLEDLKYLQSLLEAEEKKQQEVSPE